MDFLLLFFSFANVVLKKRLKTDKYCTGKSSYHVLLKYRVKIYMKKEELEKL